MSERSPADDFDFFERQLAEALPEHLKQQILIQNIFEDEFVIGMVEADISMPGGLDRDGVLSIIRFIAENFKVPPPKAERIFDLAISRRLSGLALDGAVKNRREAKERNLA